MSNEASEHGELLTVGEAAARVGLSERILSRILQSDNFSARTTTEYRQTETGQQMMTLVPPALMADLLAYYEMGKAVSEDGPKREDGPEMPENKDNGSRARTLTDPQVASLAAQIASARETILRADQERVRAEQERARAEAALDRTRAERDAEIQRLNTALSRAQDALTQALTVLTQEQQRTAHSLATAQTKPDPSLPMPPHPEAPTEHTKEPDPDAAKLQWSKAQLGPAVTVYTAVPGTFDFGAAVDTGEEMPPASDAAPGTKIGFWERLWQRIAD